MTERSKSPHCATYTAPPHIRPRRSPVSPFRGRLRRFRRNRFWLLLYLWLAILIPELVLHAAASHSIRSFFNSGLILGPLFGLVPALAVFLLCTAIPAPKVNFGITAVCSGFSLLLHGSQLVFYRVFGTFFSVHSFLNGGTLQFGDSVRSGIGGALPLLLLMALPLILLLTLGRELFSFRSLKDRSGHIPMVLCCALVHLLTVMSLPLFGGTGDTTPYGLYHRTSDFSLGVSRLGLITAFRLDLCRNITGADASGTILLDAPPPETTHPSASGVEPTASPLTMPEANALELDFAALAAAEDNEAIAQIHSYFASRTPSPKNGKTGIFRGFNLIQITSDAFRHQEVLPELTPTLYEMIQEGCPFTSYYVPDWGVSASDWEYAQLTGIIPKSGVWNRSGSAGGYMPLTMAQQLIREGYSVFACSPGDLEKPLEHLGYEWSPLDSCSPLEGWEQVVSDYVNYTPFHAYCSLGGSMDIPELERAISLLLARLDAAGVLDCTVILLATGDSETEMGSCILWAPGMEPEIVDVPTSHLDLLPTLSNLFGLEFDSRLYMGRDVFSNEAPLVPLRNRSWITDRAMFNAETGEVTSLTDAPVEEAYIKSMCNEVNNRFTVSARIPECDYWRLLFD